MSLTYTEEEYQELKRFASSLGVTLPSARVRQFLRRSNALEDTSDLEYAHTRDNSYTAEAHPNMVAETSVDLFGDLI